MVSFLQRGDGQGALSSVPLHCIEDIFGFLEIIDFGEPEMSFAVTYNAAEGLFGFSYVINCGCWISCDPAEGPDYHGTFLIPPLMATRPGVCPFGGSFQRGGDCLSDINCKFIQLGGGRVGREGRDYLIHMHFLSVDHFLEKILIEGRPAEGWDVSGWMSCPQLDS